MESIFIQFDSQKIRILLELKPIRLFVLFVSGVLFLPLLIEVFFNLIYGNALLDTVSTNVSAISMLFGYLIAYGLVLFYAKDYFDYTLENLVKKVSPRFLFFSFLIGLLFTALIVEIMILIEPPDDFGAGNAELLNGTFLSSAVMILFAALLAPIVEEFVFRAYIFDALKQKFSFAVTACLSSLLFTLPHMLGYYSYWPAAIIIFCLGLLLAYFRKRHDSLLPCIVLHSTYNIGWLVLFFIAA